MEEMIYIAYKQASHVSLHGKAISEPQTALSDPYCVVKVPPNHLLNTFCWSDIFSFSSLVPHQSLPVLTCLF